MREEAVRMDNIISQSGLQKLYAGNLCVQKGQIMAVAGLRNSGVTELIDILIGKQDFQKGHVYINGKEVTREELLRQETLGIANLHYNARLNGNLTIAENVILMNELPKGQIIRERMNNEMTVELLRILDINLPPTLKTGELDVPMQHLIMLIRAIYENKKIIILQNIHQNYTIRQMETLGHAIKKVTRLGISCIYKFYNTDPMFEYMDALTVLRNGYTAGVMEAKELCYTGKARIMMGDTFVQKYVGKGDVTKNKVLEVENFITKKNTEPVNFSIYEGETVMLINEEWEKAMDIVGVISGMDQSSYVSGNLFINGSREAIEPSKRLVRKDIAYIPENAARNTISLNMTVKDTILLTKVNILKKRFKYINERLKNYLVRRFFDLLDESEKSKKYTAHTLMADLDEQSRYAVIFYKSLLLNPKVMIIANPFSFNDEATRNYLMVKITELNKSGISVLVAARDMYRFTNHEVRVIKLI